MAEELEELHLFLKSLNLSEEYQAYFTKRNVKSIDDLQQLVGLTDYQASTELTSFALKLADERENLTLDGFKTPLSLVQQRKMEIMISKLDAVEYCKPRREDYDDGVSYYMGYFEGTERHGRGLMTLPKGIYEGQWEYGRRHGYGLYKFVNGSSFEGMFLNDNYRQGVFTWTNGNVYDGYLSGGKKHGKGTMYYADTDSVYEGDWRDGLKHGFGRSEEGGCIYQGDFRNDVPHGTGLYSWPDGSYYEGDFRYGRRTGKGKLEKGNGDCFKGDFVDDKYHGWGRYLSADGEVYDGGFKNGTKFGKGVWRSTQSGDEYKGEFENDIFHGEGFYRYANGDTYEGSYYAGLRDGNGLFLSPFENSNKEVRGSWKKDKLLVNYNPVPSYRTML